MSDHTTATATAPEPPGGHPTNKLQALRRYARDKQGTPWDSAPRPYELRDPRTYLDGVRLHRRLLREGYTMISSRRGRVLLGLARAADRTGVPGALVDCGVWNGGSTILLSAGAPGRDVWAFDSFEGLPEAGPLDDEKSVGWTGECLGAEAKLRDGFARYANPARLHVVKGWFQDTFPEAAAEVGPVAVLHADGDWYESVLLTLRTFYPLVPSGGYVAIDDYGYWIGAQRATDEFRAEVGDTTPLQRADYSGRFWQKP